MDVNEKKAGLRNCISQTLTKVKSVISSDIWSCSKCLCVCFRNRLDYSFGPFMVVEEPKPNLNKVKSVFSSNICQMF